MGLGYLIRNLSSECTAVRRDGSRIASPEVAAQLWGTSMSLDVAVGARQAVTRVVVVATLVVVGR